MKYPKFITKGNKIAFVAPSLGATTEPYLTRVKVAKEVLEKNGYVIEYGPNCFSNIKALSNTPKKCAEEINQSFLDDEIDALISVGGGELMYEILPYINFDNLRKNPKWFMGFSDNTNLTFLLPTICDVASIYGPCAGSFAPTPWHQSIIDAHQLLTGEKLTVNGYPLWEKESSKSETNPLASYNLTEETVIKKYPNQDFHFKGRLIGGCLDILVLYPGTKYDRVSSFCDKYQNDGIIWFLEACDLNVMGIRRAIVQLENAGWFNYVNGFIIGRPLNGYQDILEIDRFMAVYDILKKYNVPCIFDVDLGHLPPSMPLITGSIGEVKVNGNQITINMKLE